MGFVSRRLTLACAVVLALGTAAAAVPTLTREQGRAAVDEVLRLVGAHYVFPDKRAAIVAAVKAARDAGAYDVANPQEMAEKLTADLSKASGDGHLYMNYNPAQFADLSRPAAGRHEPSRFELDAGRERNDGYEEQKVLAGNVRYVRVSGFVWSEKTTPPIIDAAARFLSNGDAIVIDLRGNGGGHAEAVKRLVSYFFAGGSPALMSFHDGISGRTEVNRAVAKLPSPRLAGKPLYVLTDRGTGSAAEEFAYHIQQFKLGTLVGEPTAGAANNNQLFAVAPFFVASVSVGRPEHPVSHTNWEKVGVAPHVATPSTDAINQAHLMALKTLAAGGSQAQKDGYNWDIVGLEAMLKPLPMSTEMLDAYVGTYGVRRIWREGTTLKFQREQRPPTELTAMGPDLFGLANTGSVRLKFRRENGRVTGFEQVSKLGVVGVVERTG
ncbi:MAG: S41 family peptidase [Alphaproteobacteria bacterium]|nr:S41 family peptidase [Alphaproteobacteria bacterium]